MLSLFKAAPLKQLWGWASFQVMETPAVTAWLLWFMESCTLSAPPALLPRCPRDSTLPMEYPGLILLCILEHWCSTPLELFFAFYLSAKSLVISNTGCQPQEEIKSFYVFSLAYKHICSCPLLSDSQRSSNEGEQIRHAQRCTYVCKGKEAFSCTNVVHKAGREWRKAVSILPGLWDVLKECK